MSTVIPFLRICRRAPNLADGSAHTRKYELLAALESQQELRMHGYQFEQGESNGIVVMRNGHVRGLWHYGKGCYRYTPASYRQPTFKSPDLAFVMQYMRELLLPSLHNNSRHAGCERRRHERCRVDWPGVLCTTGDRQIILVEDVSAGGLGIRATEGWLVVGDPLGVELFCGYHLTGRVARVQDNKIGFARRYPLDPRDPLVMAANAAARVNHLHPQMS